MTFLKVHMVTPTTALGPQWPWRGFLTDKMNDARCTLYGQKVEDTWLLHPSVGLHQTNVKGHNHISLYAVASQFALTGTMGLSPNIFHAQREVHEYTICLCQIGRTQASCTKPWPQHFMSQNYDCTSGYLTQNQSLPHKCSCGLTGNSPAKPYSLVKRLFRTIKVIMAKKRHRLVWWSGVHCTDFSHIVLLCQL